MVSRLRGFSYLLIWDIVGLLMSLHLALYLFHNSWLVVFPWAMVPTIAVTLLALFVVGAYGADRPVAGVWIAARGLVGALLSGIFITIFVFVSNLRDNEAISTMPTFLVALVFFAGWLVLSRLALTRRAKYQAKRYWLVLGAGDWATQFRYDFQTGNTDEELVFLTQRTDFKNPNDVPSPSQLLASLQNYERTHCRGLIIAMEPPLPTELSEALARFRRDSLPVFELGEFYERFLLKVPIAYRHKRPVPLPRWFDLPNDSFQPSVNRILDIALAFTLLVLFSPIMLLIAILITLESIGPLLLVQTRTGQAGKSFPLYKFRSMYTNAEESGPRWAANDDPRVTQVGRVIRATHLDELPQLINVLKGEMSLIGPRPERPVFNDILRRRIPLYSLRHLVKPGITGWAQVMYSYGASERDAMEKLQYDLYYVKNQSLSLDIAILFKTLRAVVSAQGR